MNSQLEQEVRELIRETEDMNDAINYADTVAQDCDVSVDVVIEEIKRQYQNK